MIKFTYWLMWSWKTADLINTYENDKNNKYLITFKWDIRSWEWFIKSRNGKKLKSDNIYDNYTNFLEEYKNIIKTNIYVDESQFLSKAQIYDIIELSKNNNIFFYWLLTTFQHSLFSWSEEIIKIADNVKNIINKEDKCMSCNINEPRVNARYINWTISKEGEVEWIESWKIEYKTICLKCFNKK